jgi:hypothetical protein
VGILTSAEFAARVPAERRTLIEVAVAGVAARWRTTHTVIYGSILRDDFGPASDIDIVVLDDGLSRAFRSEFRLGAKVVSVNLAPSAVILRDACRLSYGGYYAAKFALPALALSRRSAAVLRRNHALLVNACASATSPAQAAVMLFPAYRAFAVNKAAVTRCPGGRLPETLTGDERLLLARFRSEGQRMHALDRQWWECYKTRAGIPEGWD